MKVYIDGQDCADIAGDGGAPSILDAVTKRVSKAGRVVTEIRLDDVVMGEEAFSNVNGGLAAHFTSQPVRELVLETLDEALKYIPKLTKGLDEIALHFEKNEFTTGEEKLADAADGLDWLLQVFQKCGSLLAVGGDDGGLSKSLFESISSLGDFHAEKQYTRMAFCIREKLVPEIGNFSIQIQKLRDLASSTQ